MDRIIKPQAAADTLGVSLPHLYRLGREGKAPRPVKIGAKASGFLESEIDAFLKARIEERNQAGQTFTNPVARAGVAQ